MVGVHALIQMIRLLLPHLRAGNIILALECLRLLSKTSLSGRYAAITDKRLEDLSISLPLCVLCSDKTHSIDCTLEMVFALALLVLFQPHGVIDDLRILFRLLLLNLRREIRETILDMAIEL